MEQRPSRKRKQIGHMVGWFIRAINRTGCRTHKSELLEFESMTKGQHSLLSNDWLTDYCLTEDCSQPETALLDQTDLKTFLFPHTFWHLPFLLLLCFCLSVALLLHPHFQAPSCLSKYLCPEAQRWVTLNIHMDHPRATRWSNQSNPANWIYWIFDVFKKKNKKGTSRTLLRFSCVCGRD